VIVGAGAKIIGNIQIGSDSIVGSNSVVTKSFPENSKIVGINININKKVEEISTRENILEKFLNHFHLESAPTILY
jgi:serine acetyltransferase